MKNRLHEPRSVTVIRHVSGHLLSTSRSLEAYADDVKRLYQESVTNLAARSVKFHGDGDAIADMKANGQLVGRYLNRTTRIPVDLEEALVLALPEVSKRECLADLAGRYNLLAAPMPDVGTCDDIANLNRIMTETGKAIQSLGPIFEDGKVTDDDLPYIKQALQSLTKAVSEFVSMQQRLTDVLPGADVVHLHKA